MGSVKNFGRTSCNVLATHTRVGCTSNIVALHFSCEENGWTSCHNNCKDMSQLYSLSSPRIEIIKFSFSGTYEQSSVGLYFFDNPYERIIFQNVEAECSSHTESIWLKYLFSQTSFMYVKPRIISERSRCLLVVFSASFENVRVNKLVVPR